MPISVSSFAPPRGTNEYFLTVTPDKEGSFSEEYQSVMELYSAKLAELRLGLETCVYMNIYASDAVTHEGMILESSCMREMHRNRIAVSILQQPSLCFKVALLAYHMVSESPPQKELISISNNNQSVVSIFNKSYVHYFLKGLTDGESLSVKDQTKNLFGIISSFCKSRGISTKNIVRTWIYLRDIDADYWEMVEGRKEVFIEWGLTETDNFPASTGIGGMKKNPHNFVVMDALIIDGAKDGQFNRMEAPRHMPSAMAYGVTFERGLRVEYGDRTHLHISGTASIDINGNVLHRNDVIKQTEQTLENIRGLLAESSSSIDEVVYFIVYLRESSDAEQVKKILNKNMPSHIPWIMLQARVCRPDWLIEIEGMAISKSHNPRYNCY